VDGAVDGRVPSGTAHARLETEGCRRLKPILDPREYGLYAEGQLYQEKVLPSIALLRLRVGPTRKRGESEKTGERYAQDDAELGVCALRQSVVS
jgi:hypothetical protein